MNLDDELADLVREWKEIDMRTLRLVINTTRKRTRAEAGVWFTVALTALGIGSTFVTCAVVAQDPQLWSIAAAVIHFMILAIIVPSTWAKVAQLRTVDRLLDGLPMEIVQARRELLLMEMKGWNGRSARFAWRVIAPLCALMVTWEVWIGSMPLLVATALTAAGVAVLAYGRFRLPAIRAEIAELDRMLRELAEA